MRSPSSPPNCVGFIVADLITVGVVSVAVTVAAAAVTCRACIASRNLGPKSTFFPCKPSIWVSSIEKRCVGWCRSQISKMHENNLRHCFGWPTATKLNDGKERKTNLQPLNLRITCFYSCFLCRIPMAYSSEMKTKYHWSRYLHHLDPYMWWQLEECLTP